MLCVMHDGTPYGHLKVNTKVLRAPDLARMFGATLTETEGWILELETAGVFSLNEAGCIYSRRMVRDEKVRQARAAGGIKGGNPMLMQNLTGYPHQKAEVKSKVGRKVNLAPNLAPNLRPTPASASASAVNTAPSASRSTQERAELFQSLAEACRLSSGELGPTAKRGLAVALNDIQCASPGVTAAEILARSEAYRRRMPAGCRITPHALAKHWAGCGQGLGTKATGSTDCREPPGWRDVLEKHYPGNAISRDPERSWASITGEPRDKVLAVIKKGETAA